MKHIKLVITAVLALLALSSCETGSTGQTIVQFADTSYNDGFGAGWLYVPLTISGSEMNTCDVDVTVQVVDFESEYTKAQENVDFQITSYNLVFRPEVEEVALEIQLMETDPMKLPDIMEFKLEIVSSNTNIGANKECLVHLEKTTADRLCGSWYLSYEAPNPNYGDVANPSPVTVTWDSANACFNVLLTNNSSSVYGTFPITMFFDEENDYIILPAYNFVTWYDTGIAVCQFLATNIRQVTYTDGSIGMIADRAGDDLIGTYDKENFQSITFPSSDVSVAMGYTYVDESGNPTDMNFFGTGMVNMKLTRTRE